MKFILDTYALLWTITNPDLLGKNTREIIENSLNRIYISSISLWEISLKIRIGKLEIKGFEIHMIPNLLEEMDIEILDFSGLDAIGFAKFEWKEHRDPFDLILVYLSIKNSYTLISKDKKILEASLKGLKVIW